MDEMTVFCERLERYLREIEEDTRQEEQYQICYDYMREVFGTTEMGFSEWLYTTLKK